MQIFMPDRQCNAFQNLDMNSLSQSEMISTGSLFLQYQCSKNRPASRLADKSILVGIIWMSAPSLSVVVRIQSIPLSVGKGPIKSIATLSPRLFGTGKGCKGLGRFVVGDLLCWHVSCLKVAPHVWPIIVTVEKGIRLVHTKVAHTIVGQAKELFMDIPGAGND